MTGGCASGGRLPPPRLYHPKRIERPVLRNGGGEFQGISWEKALSLVSDALAGSRAAGRKNLYLSGRTTGSFSRLIGTFCRTLEVERLPEFEVFSHSAVEEANGLLFGEREVPHYRIENADFLLTVGADILEPPISPGPRPPP